MRLKATLSDRCPLAAGSFLPGGGSGHRAQDGGGGGCLGHLALKPPLSKDGGCLSRMVVMTLC